MSFVSKLVIILCFHPLLGGHILPQLHLCTLAGLKTTRLETCSFRLYEGTWQGLSAVLSKACFVCSAVWIAKLSSLCRNALWESYIRSRVTLQTLAAYRELCVRGCDGFSLGIFFACPERWGQLSGGSFSYPKYYVYNPKPSLLWWVSPESWSWEGVVHLLLMFVLSLLCLCCSSTLKIRLVIWIFRYAFVFPNKSKFSLSFVALLNVKVPVVLSGQHRCVSIVHTSCPDWWFWGWLEIPQRQSSGSAPLIQASWVMLLGMLVQHCCNLWYIFVRIWIWLCIFRFKLLAVFPNKTKCLKFSSKSTGERVQWFPEVLKST